MRKKTRFYLFILLAFLAGVLVAAYQYAPIEHDEIISLSIARPIDVRAIYFIQHYNNKLSEEEATKLYQRIEDTIKRYKSDAHYDRGVCNQITPRLFLALILKESSARSSVISNHGAIGLSQVMPLHLDNLHKAGVIETPTRKELLKAESNIDAGIHILMSYSRNVESVHRALSIYNAGPRKERFGRGYARDVIKILEEIGG